MRLKNNKFVQLKLFLTKTLKLIFNKTKIVLLLILLVGANNISRSQNSSQIPGEIIVMTKSKESINEVVKQFSYVNGIKTSLKIKSLLSSKMNIYLLEFDSESINSNQLLQLLQSSPWVTLAEINSVIQYRNNPYDSLFTSQWNMNNSGQNSGTAGSDIDALKAWDITTGGVTSSGDTIVVAVVDAGFDLHHEDLNFWKNYNEIPNNTIDDDNNGYADDYNGWNHQSQNDVFQVIDHGTHVTGIVGAKGGNRIGVSGVNWKVKVMPVSTDGNTDADVVAAYSYVMEQRRLYNQSNGSKGAFVVATNSSFGLDLEQASSHPLWCAMYDSLGKVGILSAAATANNNYNVDTQGDIPTSCSSNWLVTVTSTNNKDIKPTNRAYGLTTIDIGAPGENVLSTLPSNTYGSLSGASMASPHVAGAIALMYSVGCNKFISDCKSKPDSMALIVKDSLLSNVDKISSLNNITVSGGRLNINKAVQSILNLYSTDTCKINPDTAVAWTPSPPPLPRHDTIIIPSTTDSLKAALDILNIYPNPTINKIKVKFISYDVCPYIDMKIVNSLGETISNIQITNTGNGLQISEIDLGNLQSGVYFVKFNCNVTSSNYWKLVIW